MHRPSSILLRNGGMPATERHRGLRAERPELFGLTRRAIALWLARRRGRFALADLQDHQLRDIGISRQEADEEAARWL